MLALPIWTSKTLVLSKQANEFCANLVSLTTELYHLRLTNATTVRSG